jgi:Spy/CpxP family protein refolding chaperone
MMGGPQKGMAAGMMGMQGMMGGSGMGGPGMGMMGGMMGQGMAGMGGMKGMEGGMPAMMGMEMMGGKGMEMMGGMMGMGGMKMPSALPGFPGASHIYHIGATGFFLDHPEHLKLTTRQQADLNRIKEKALLDQASTQRKTEEADQELWMLTASDRPDAARIEAKVREIERLRGEQRLAFIRAVGEAAKVLTDEQRKALLGTPADKPEQPPAHTGH